MSILFLTRSYYPNVGGVEKHIEKISELLVKEGKEISIISENPEISDSNHYHSNILSANITVKGNPQVYFIKAGKDNWFKKLRIWKELFSRIDLIRKAEIVHAHDVYFWYLPFRFIFPFKKNYVTFHGYEGNKMPNKRSVFMHKIAEMLTNGNICIGKFLEKWYGTKADFISYGAVDKKYTDQKKAVKKQANKGVYIGRLEHEAGILEYLKAIKILKDKGVQVTVDVFGEGNLKDIAKEYVKANDLAVTFKGFVQNIEERLSIYGFAFVSRYLGILEALSFELPVIAHYNNAIKKDYLEMTPFSKYIKIVGSKEEIAIGLEDILKRDNKKNILGYAWVKENTWEKMSSIYLKLWSQRS